MATGIPNLGSSLAGLIAPQDAATPPIPGVGEDAAAAGLGPIVDNPEAGAPSPTNFPTVDPKMVEQLLAVLFAEQGADQRQLAAAQKQALANSPLFLQLIGLLPKPGAGLSGQAIGGKQELPSVEDVTEAKK